MSVPVTHADTGHLLSSKIIYAIVVWGVTFNPPLFFLPVTRHCISVPKHTNDIAIPY